MALKSENGKERKKANKNVNNQSKNIPRFNILFEIICHKKKRNIV